MPFTKITCNFQIPAFLGIIYPMEYPSKGGGRMTSRASLNHAYAILENKKHHKFRDV